MAVSVRVCGVGSVLHSLIQVQVSRDPQVSSGSGSEPEQVTGHRLRSNTGSYPVQNRCVRVLLMFCVTHQFKGTVHLEL